MGGAAHVGAKPQEAEQSPTPLASTTSEMTAAAGPITNPGRRLACFNPRFCFFPVSPSASWIPCHFHQSAAFWNEPPAARYAATATPNALKVANAPKSVVMSSCFPMFPAPSLGSTQNRYPCRQIALAQFVTQGASQRQACGPHPDLPTISGASDSPVDPRIMAAMMRLPARQRQVVALRSAPISRTRVVPQRACGRRTPRPVPWDAPGTQLGSASAVTRANHARRPRAPAAAGRRVATGRSRAIRASR